MTYVANRAWNCELLLSAASERVKRASVHRLQRCLDMSARGPRRRVKARPRELLRLLQFHEPDSRLVAQ